VPSEDNHIAMMASGQCKFGQRIKAVLRLGELPLRAFCKFRIPRLALARTLDLQPDALAAARRVPCDVPRRRGVERDRGVFAKYGGDEELREDRPVKVVELRTRSSWMRW
jgi:hypothetical protein